MRTLPAQSALLVLGPLLMACGHAPTLSVTATVPAEAIEWRTAPGQGGLRLALVIANRSEGTPSGSWPRRLLTWLAGTEEVATEADRLQHPHDVVALATGGFAVADPDAGRVARFDARGAFQAFVSCQGGAWQAPIALAEPASGTLLVVDGADGRVFRWTSTGCAALDVRFDRPTGIASNGGPIYVADAGASAVVVLSGEGREISRWTASTTGDAFVQPSAVAIAPDASVWVVDGLGARVAHLTPEGKLRGTLGPAASGGGLARPKGVHVDVSNRVFVSDAQRDQLLVFGPDGTLQLTVGGEGDGPGQFAHPAGIGGAGDRIVVADSLNRRLQVFEVIGATR